MRKVIFYFLTFFIIVVAGLWLLLHSELFWNWAGQKIITSTNQSLRGKLSVAKIEGTPFSGYVFKDIKIDTPEGEILNARGFMLRLSLWSIIELKPVIDKMALYKPVLNLEKDAARPMEYQPALPAPERLLFINF